jgi:endoglucanase
MKASVFSVALLQAVAQCASVPRSSDATGFKWLGVSESVAEFGQGTYPGTYGKEFYFPDPNTIDVGDFKHPSTY